MDSSGDTEKRPMFGNRLLTSNANVFQHNAWDNVEWTDEQEEDAHKTTLAQLEKSMPAEEQSKYLNEPSAFWDKFYSIHDNKFFKDRNWLFTEFPELLKESSKLNVSEEGDVAAKEEFPGQGASLRIFEVGCGAGNTIFPLMKAKVEESFFMYGCDYAPSAVEVVKNSTNYNTKRCHVFVHDITSSENYPMPEESLDIIIMIFVLSALDFNKMKQAVEKLSKLLKKGGLILFRDYGRYDMAQLRFKGHRCISKNFYTRGDGTLVYFLTQDEVRDIFTSAGLVEEQNLVDRRLQVNRAKQVKMYRVWIQGKYRKPL